MHNVKDLLINFIKYEACGNDFIIVIKESKINNLIPKIIKNTKKICDRNFGIGADGIILVNEDEDNIKIEIINADGSIAKNCGNGLRCVADLYFNKYKKSSVKIDLNNIIYQASKEDDNICVSMGDSQVTLGDFKLSLELSLIIDKILLVKIGNEHIVFFLNKRPDNLHDIILNIHKDIGDLKEYNLSFVFIEDDQIFCEVYERGVGFTKSCGTGAMAVASCLSFLDENFFKSFIEIKQPGGSIWVCAKKTDVFGHFELRQKGPARPVFGGQMLPGLY